MQTIFNLPAGAPANIDAGDVHEWLAEQGFAIEGVSVRADQVRIETVDDSQLVAIQAAFDGYRGERSAKNQELDAIDAAAWAFIQNVRQKPPGTRTQQDAFVLAVARRLSGISSE